MLLGKVKSVSRKVTAFGTKNIGTIGAGVGGVAIGSVLGAVAVSSRFRKSRRKRVRRSYSRTRSRRRYPKARRVRHTKKTSHRRIHYSKNGQPYVILKNGKARFISKRSARISRKRKGGKY